MTTAAPPEGLEIDTPPRFALGSKVRARALVRNDGTMPGHAVGDVLVQAGDEGYVRDVGAFLQQFWIYAVDFIGSRRVVGMRADELDLVAPPLPHDDGEGTR
jgi:nitrogen fixation protein NifZ